MQLTIDLTYTDGETEQVVAYPADFIAWERHAGRRMSQLADGIGMEDIAFLAYSAKRRGGEKRPPFDVWVDRLADIGETDESTTADPSPPAAPDGSSSS